MAKNKIGAAVAVAPKEKPAFSLISNEKLLELYSTMVKCRMLDERARLLFKQGKLAANSEDAVGQEATIVAVTIGLVRGDTIIPSRQGIMAGLVNGASPGRLLRLLSARAESGAKSSSSPAQFNRAVKTGVKLKKTGKVVLILSGGSTSADTWYEALETAGAKRLPVIFVRLADLSNKRMSAERQALAGDFERKTQASGVPGIVVDGNDVVAVYRVACEAMARARKGGGPSLIDCRRYRLSVDSQTSDGAAGRIKKLDQRVEHDPILNMERYLARKGLFNAPMKRRLKAGFKRELDAATRICEELGKAYKEG